MDGKLTHVRIGWDDMNRIDTLRRNIATRTGGATVSKSAVLRQALAIGLSELERVNAPTTDAATQDPPA